MAAGNASHSRRCPEWRRAQRAERPNGRRAQTFSPNQRASGLREAKRSERAPGA